MKINYDDLPKHTRWGITAVLVAVGGSLAFNLGRATKVHIGTDGIEVIHQAQENQSELEKQLLLQQVQKAAIEELRQDIHDFARQYEAGRELKEQVDFVADIVPDNNLDELKERIGESEHTLSEAIAPDGDEN
ncbi:MAG: hypothetical protein AAGF26_14210 [Cyanobacteria bacterium P01_G01_bin.49]